MTPRPRKSRSLGNTRHQHNRAHTDGNLRLPRVSKREHSAILAALRLYEAQRSRREPIAAEWLREIATNAGTHTELSVAGIGALCQKLNARHAVDTAPPDPYACLTTAQVAELMEAAIQTIMRDLDGADESQAQHWAECYLHGKEHAQTYLDVLDWDRLDAGERAALGLSFDPQTGKPLVDRPTPVAPPPPGARQFEVEFIKSYSVTGIMAITATDDGAAFKKADAMLRDHDQPLQSNDPRIEWGTPIYIDDSFDTNGEVYPAAL